MWTFLQLNVQRKFSEGKGEMDPGVKFRLYVGNRRLEGNTWLHILWNLRQYLPMTWGWWCWTGSFVSSLHFKLNQAYFHFLLKSFDLSCIPSPHARPMIFYFLLQCEWVCVAVRKQDLGFSQTPFPFKDISFTFIFLNFNTKNGNSCSIKEQPLFDGIMSQRASTWPAIW